LAFEKTLGKCIAIGARGSVEYTPARFIATINSQPGRQYVRNNEKATEFPSATIADSKHQRDGGKGCWRGGAIAPSFKHEETLQTLTDKAVAFIQRQSKEKPFLGAPKPEVGLNLKSYLSLCKKICNDRESGLGDKTRFEKSNYCCQRLYFLYSLMAKN